MFAEDLSVFTDTATGFAIEATLAAVPVQVLFDAPGVDALDGEVVTQEPSVLILASEQPAAGQALVIDAGDLTAASAHLAGTYTLRSLMPEAPDGAFVRCFLGRVS